MPSAKVMLELVTAVYEASANPERWPSFLEVLAGHLHANHVVLLAEGLDRPGEYTFPGARFDPQDINRFATEFSDNIWVRRANQRYGSSDVRYSQGLTTSTELRATRFFEDYLRPLDIGNSIGLKLQYGRSIPGYLAVTRSWRSEFDDADGDLLMSLLPHLERALSLQTKIFLNSATTAALDSFSTGILLMNFSGRPVWWNRYVEQILECADGFAIASGVIQIRQANEFDRFQQILKQALNTGPTGVPEGGTMAISRTSLRQPYHVLISPLRGVDSTLRHAAALVMIDDPEVSVSRQPEHLRNYFGFTKAEAGLAARLVEGLTIKEAAGELSISLDTARTHIRQILRKAGVRGQSELMKTLLRTPTKTE